MVIFINHYQIYLKQFNISNSFAYNSTRPTFPILSIEQNNWLDFTLNRIHSNVRFQFQYHHFTSISFQQWAQFTRIKISTREKRNNSSTLIFLAKRTRNSLSLSHSLFRYFLTKNWNSLRSSVYFRIIHIAWNSWIVLTSWTPPFGWETRIGNDGIRATLLWLLRPNSNPRNPFNFLETNIKWCVLSMCQGTLMETVLVGKESNTNFLVFVKIIWFSRRKRKWMVNFERNGNLRFNRIKFHDLF